MSVYGSKTLLAELRAGFKQAGKKLNMGKSCIRFKRADDLDLETIGKPHRENPAAEVRRDREGGAAELGGCGGAPEPRRSPAWTGRMSPINSRLCWWNQGRTLITSASAASPATIVATLTAARAAPPRPFSASGSSTTSTSEMGVRSSTFSLLRDDQ